MPSDSIAGFLDKAQANRVLFPEQVELLIRQPDIPQSNLESLCAYLEQRGALTRFQAETLRAGRGQELSFAGYPVLDEIGPCPGGTAYRALHPSLRTPILLRRFRPEALAPADNPTGFIERARNAAGVHHPNLITLLDAGDYRGEAYAAYEPPTDAASLDALVRDIGPMPGFLAAEYGREAAAALRTLHERGLWHGDVRPANLFVGPMISKVGTDGSVKRRPAPNASIRVAEAGLVPLRPPAAAHPPTLEEIPYLPPERLDGGGYDSRGDLYGLGMALYFLLIGRPPFTGNSPAELLNKVRSAEPAPLTALRPDLPPALAAFVHQLLNKHPELRPPTAFDVEQTLIPFCRPGTVPVPTAVPLAAHPVAVAVPVAQPLPVPVPVSEGIAAPSDEWGGGDSFTAGTAEEAPPPRRRLTEQDKSRARMLLGLGLLMHLSAVGLLIFLLAQSGCFGSSSSDTPAPAPKKEKPAKPRKPDTHRHE